MDKKAKKKLHAANQRLQELRRRLAGAKRQQDDPGEISRLQREIATLEARIQSIKSS